MQIIGNGNIDSMVSGSNTTYTAIPDKGFSFKYWSYNGGTYQENPITLPTTTTIDSVTFYYSISSYLRGMVGFEIKDENLISIIHRRAENLQTLIDLNTDITDLSAEAKDLLYADVLIWGSTGYSNYGNVSDSDGAWSHQESSSTITATDKKRFESIAKSIYDLYHDTINTHPSIRIVTL